MNSCNNMELDKQSVQEITLKLYKNEVDLFLKGIECLEQLIILRDDNPKLFSYKENQKNEMVAISICIVRIYKTLNVMKDILIKGYYSEAFSLLRNVEEVDVLITYFEKKPDKALSWMKSEFKPKYGNMCDELGLKTQINKTHYKSLCEHTHPNFDGNLFLNWDVDDKIKETRETNFKMEIVNNFDEFHFICILGSMLIILNDSIMRQLKTIDLSKETKKKFVEILHGEQKHPFKEVITIVNEYHEETKKANEKIHKKMIEIAKENRTDISEP